MPRHGSCRVRRTASTSAMLAVLAALLFTCTVQAAATIYPDVARADADIAAGLKDAARDHRRVLVDFGGNWCPDCIVLDHHFHAAENAELLKKHYILVHVNVGDKGITDSFAIAERYGIALRKGVPALAVLEPDGHVVFAQKQGEFEAMRELDPATVRTFLTKWAR